MNWWKKILAVKVSLIVAILAVALTNSLNKIHERNLEVKYLKQQVEQSRKIAEQNQKLAEKMMGMECRNLAHLKVTVSAYVPVKAQCDSDPLIGADNTLISPGQIAISRDLMSKYGIKFGDKVVIENLGTFCVKDVMNKRFKKRVDILTLVPAYAKEFGVKTNTTLYFNKN